ncbi:HpcH/HpaI aldolase family protein [Mangrovicoccus algicola]|uniref:4-hydroxy-2-oxo-heptane-1,7-dioate aldolase n=1 Tax=Mangrovicoccus algicola TaxID=2771008 RepID=A0A8J6YZ87_9RHOB|nr:aldolase/citrate lyase family protein [Mangrovicoccus algicola]MBE3638543.1 4-hydroxy-2-oxo-heptane-1,7-dioate aldolase [Mangrovicoccus algicola]
MEPFKNPFKTALAEFRLQRGLWCTLSDPLAVEMMAGLGFDWMMFDTEHSAVDAVSVLPLLQAAARWPVHPVVRPTHLNAPEIKKLLDLGAQTLLIPMVEDAQMAAHAVACATYPPRGIRGVSGVTRATGFGAVPGYHARAGEEICLLVQVESKSALSQIEAIAAVPGIDGIFVGPADLAASLGHPGNPGHPEVVAAVIDAIRRIRAAGLPPGLLTTSPELHAAACDAGVVFLAGDLDITALRKGLLSGLGLGGGAARSALPSGDPAR